MDVDKAPRFDHLRRRSGPVAHRLPLVERTEQQQEKQDGLVEELKGLIASLKTCQAQKDSAQGEPLWSTHRYLLTKS